MSSAASETRPSPSAERGVHAENTGGGAAASEGGDTGLREAAGRPRAAALVLTPRAQVAGGQAASSSSGCGKVTLKEQRPSPGRRSPLPQDAPSEGTVERTVEHMGIRIFIGLPPVGGDMAVLVGPGAPDQGSPAS